MCNLSCKLVTLLDSKISSRFWLGVIFTCCPRERLFLMRVQDRAKHYSPLLIARLLQGIILEALSHNPQIFIFYPNNRIWDLQSDIWWLRKWVYQLEVWEFLIILYKYKFKIEVKGGQPILPHFRPYLKLPPTMELWFIGGHYKAGQLAPHKTGQVPPISPLIHLGARVTPIRKSWLKFRKKF